MDTKQRIRDFLAENFLFSAHGFDLADDDSLLENGVVDSTGVLELIQFLEGDLGVPVADDDVVPGNFDSVDKIAAFIQQKRHGADCAVKS
ncbi:MAG: acyl carrier protein [Planctomycetaceae bacterium]|nr:acyl carrier protein [Planctomycetaceae bacterium]